MTANILFLWHHDTGVSLQKMEHNRKCTSYSPNTNHYLHYWMREHSGTRQIFHSLFMLIFCLLRGLHVSLVLYLFFKIYMFCLKQEREITSLLGSWPSYCCIYRGKKKKQDCISLLLCFSSSTKLRNCTGIQWQGITAKAVIGPCCLVLATVPSFKEGCIGEVT